MQITLNNDFLNRSNPNVRPPSTLIYANNLSPEEKKQIWKFDENPPMLFPPFIIPFQPFYISS